MYISLTRILLSNDPFPAKPAAFFYGVEQRDYLVDMARIAHAKLGRMKVQFESRNFTQMDFNDYDHFYFYNSFFENLAGSSKIDDTIEHSPELFNYYNRFLSKKLSEKTCWNQDGNLSKYRI